MPRLIDDLRASSKLVMPNWVALHRMDAWRKHAARIGQFLTEERSLPVILIDNVAQFYFSSSEQEHWDLRRDFPNLAPPFPIAWYEHKMVKTIHSRECGDTDVASMVPDGRVGMLISAIDPKDAKADGEIPPGVRWILWMELFIDYGRFIQHNGVVVPQHGIVGPHGSVFLMVDEHGAVLDRPWMQGYAYDDDAGIMRSLMTWFNPAYLAISFLHCRNVGIVDNPVPKPLAKKYHARTGQWPTPYRTLVIEPLKQILRHEGNSDKLGIQRALHICRGHFRDYRQGRGLFGRYHQLVWTPSIVRGTKGKSAPPREIEVKL